MASTALGRGRTERGKSVSFLIGTRLAVMRVSPLTLRPFCRVATRDTLEIVEGKMRPRMARTLLLTRTASAKSPVTWVRAARKRLPKLWPIKPRPAWKRYWKRRPRRASSFERATMQLRMSPGGRMRFSRRKRPELPPSSVTVTMAARSAMGRSVLARSSVRRMTSSLRPRRSVERPVPPPRATTRKPRDRVFGLELRFVMRVFGMAEQVSFYRKEFNTENSEDTESTEKKKTGQAEACPTKRLAGGAVFLRIEELGEARVFLEESKIFVVARVIAVFRAQLDGDFEIGEGGIGFAGEAIEGGQRVVNMVGLGRGLAGFVETFAGIVPAADVHHGDAALIMFIRSAGILLLRRLHALLGDFHVHARAIGEFLAGAFEYFFQFLLGTSEFLLMKESQSFVVDFELRLNTGVNQLDTPTLGGRRWRESLLFL